MPQLMKGGKHVFSWVTISEAGSITIPPEAFREYGFKPDERVVLLPGSRSSGGFAVVPQRNLTNSPMNPLRNLETVQEDQVLMSNGKPFIVTRLKEGDRVSLSVEALKVFGLDKVDKVLAVRGSGLGPSFVARGSIIEEALKHPELEEC